MARLCSNRGPALIVRPSPHVIASLTQPIWNAGAGAIRRPELGQGDAKTVTIGADDSIDEALRTMIDHKVRRLPVIDGKRLVGIISQADIATNVEEEKVGDLVEAISAAP